MLANQVRDYFMQTKDNIELTDIQRELTKLWDSLEGSNKIRACLFNLIVYTHNASRIDYFQSLIRLVIDKLPCRIIFVQGTTDSKSDSIRTRVSAEMSGSGNSIIACDLITIEASGRHVERVPYIILPNIVPDLPVYLLWGSDPTMDSHILPAMSKVANRLIFDSEVVTDLPHFSRNLLKRMESLPMEVVDMNWARTKGWRDVVAHAFNTPERLQMLADSKTLNIVYNRKESDSFEHCKTQALFVQGWIAAQLDWNLQSHQYIEGNLRLVYRSNGREIVVSLVPGLAEHHSPGTMLGLELHTHHGDHVKLSLHPENKVVDVNISTSQKCEVPFRLLLGRLTIDQALMNEVLYEGISSHYRSMLHAIAAIAGPKH